MKIQSTYPTDEFDPRTTPPSHQSTLKRIADSSNYGTLKSPPQTSSSTNTTTAYDAPPPLYSAIFGASVDFQKNFQFDPPTNPLSPHQITDLHLQIQEQNYIDYSRDKSSIIRPDYLDFESNSLDYRILNATNSTAQDVNMRSKTLNSNDFRHSGSDFIASNITNEFSQQQQHQTDGNLTATLQRGSSTLNKFRNSRNHIITDTIPGPESCV